jgi:hypothetical protein
MPTMERGFAALTTAVTVLIVVSALFAAFALFLRVRHEQGDQRLTRLTGEWEPAMLSLLAGTGMPETLARIEPDQTPEFLAFLLGYARRLKGDERDTVHELAGPYLATLLDEAEGRSAERRGKAIQVLASMGMPEYADTVAAALDDDSTVVAMIAARGLFRPGMEDHFQAVLDRLPRFTLWSRSVVGGQVARGGAGAAAPHQTNQARPGGAPLNPAIAADALRILNDLPTVEVANDILHVQSDPELVVACLRLIRHLGHRDHADVVRPLTESADSVVRAAAVGALAAIGEPSEVPLIRDMLDDDAYWVSLEAARGLLALGDVNTLRRLASAQGPWSVLAQQVLSE